MQEREGGRERGKEKFMLELLRCFEMKAGEHKRRERES